MSALRTPDTLYGLATEFLRTLGIYKHANQRNVCVAAAVVTRQR
jgi:hypothetical protein